MGECLGLDDVRSVKSNPFVRGPSQRNLVAAERRAAYLEWLLTPESERRPSTKGELAAELGISAQALRGYAKEAAFQYEYQKRLRELNRVERVPTILAGLYARAQGEGAVANQAAKVLLDWMSRDELGPPPVDLTQISDEDLVEMGRRLLDMGHSV